MRARQIRSLFHLRWTEYCEFAKSGPRPEDYIVAVKRPHTVLLAGRDYLTGFFEYRDRGLDCFEFDAPLASMPIGKQLQWLSQSVAADIGQLLLPFEDG